MAREPSFPHRNIQALFNYKLLNEASLSSLIEIEDGFGKGIFEQSLDGVVSYSHRGAIYRFRSLLGYQPSRKFSIAILSNGKNIHQDKILMALVLATRSELVKIP